MSKGIMITEAGELADGRPYAERSEREPGLHDKAAEFLLGHTVRPGAPGAVRFRARLGLHRPSRATARIGVGAGVGRRSRCARAGHARALAEGRV